MFTFVVVYIVFMSIVVLMKIRQNRKMGVSCRIDTVERKATAAIRPPYCFNCVKWFYLCSHFYFTRFSYYDINNDNKPSLLLVLLVVVVVWCFLV
jgi:hypothetical protein